MRRPRPRPRRCAAPHRRGCRQRLTAGALLAATLLGALVLTPGACGAGMHSLHLRVAGTTGRARGVASTHDVRKAANAGAAAGMVGVVAKDTSSVDFDLVELALDGTIRTSAPLSTSLGAFVPSCVAHMHVHMRRTGTNDTVQHSTGYHSDGSAARSLISLRV